MTEANNSLKIESVCFTGHRIIEASEAFMLPTNLKSILTKLIRNGAKHFYAGGAIGFDTIAALCVLELKEIYPDIELGLILPCKDQTKYWNDADKKAYRYIMSAASTVEFVSESYNSYCMHERNKRLVDRSQLCIAYLKHSNGGTAHTYSYAVKNGVEVINLA